MHILTPTRELRIVPNVRLYKGAFSNLSRPTDTRTEALQIGFSYDDPPNRVKEVLTALLAETPGILNLNSAVAGLKMAHLLEITSAFEFAVLTLTVPGLRLRKYQNPLCFRVSAPFSSSLTAEFRIILVTTHRILRSSLQFRR